MESEKITLGNYLVDCHRVNTLIIGSGAAALNAAVSLHSLGVKDTIIATQQLQGGTSNNAGSDKQTYYKLSLSGKEPDSVIDMASDLFRGRCMHGDIALCEAQGSVRSFMKLVELGVEFPHDTYGSFAGYKTDHDPRSRATSAGPYTSRRMHEALLSEVRRRGITILDDHHFVALLTSSDKSKITGALAIKTIEKDYTKAFVLFNAVNIVLGTGGPAGIYAASVYPESQTGATGMAFHAGATGQNLTESQFGIASVKFRWNLSGSYQQAIPRYVSTDADGNEEQEFLNPHFPDLKTLTKAIFLKGYQWPFDPRKIDNYGSSLIDILVDNEINSKGRRVFLDFMKNPEGKNGEKFSIDILDQVPGEYLRKCGALQGTPFERLKAINPPAIALYRDHGIDLEKERLRIAVCAQHNNGGLKGDIWWESDLKHLFPVGEVNGSHGVYRPGGAALNSGQVGSFRAAMYISRNYRNQPVSNASFLGEVKPDLENILGQAEKWIASPDLSALSAHFNEIMIRMSASGGIRRSAKDASEAFSDAEKMFRDLPAKIGALDIAGLKECFRLMDHCLTHLVYLGAIKYYTANGGRSRGSCLVSEGKSDLPLVELCNFDRNAEKNIVEVSYSNGTLVFNETSPREIPDQDLWFERVWKDYMQENCGGIDQISNIAKFGTRN